MNFHELKITPTICELLKRNGIIKPTVVQEKVIPSARSGRDLIVQAKTGTGKTLAFLLPTIERIKKVAVTQALIIAPTRELAIQIFKVASEICKVSEVVGLLISGGQDIDRQKDKLRRVPQIIIGTPGRLLGHLRRGTIQLKHVNKVIIDEADELLKLGFIEDVELLIRETSSDRQLILCSATMPLRIRQLASEFMNKPQEILIEPKIITPKSINQVVVKTNPDQKLSRLAEIIETEQPYLAMVFCAKKETVSYLTMELAIKHFDVDELHGDLTQQQRNFVLKKFRDAKIQILVATDIAARGLDVEGVTHVISYDIPRDVESYIHRIGRVGRADKSGTAITLVTPNEIDKLRRIEQGIKKPISVQRPPRAKQIKSAVKHNRRKK